MKQITEIDDPRLVKALAHPLRVHILRVLQERVASPSELSEELGAPLGNVSYHVRYLERFTLVELVDTRPRRGAVEHYYRAVGRLRITDRAWAQVPQIIKDAMVKATLDESFGYVGAAAAIGGFERADAHASRTPLVLDEQGFAELSDAVRKLVDRAAQIESESAVRLAVRDHIGREVSAGLVLMLFEAPPAYTGIPPANGGSTAHRRAKTRTR